MGKISFVIQDFNELSEEVSKYFIFLQDLEQGKVKLIKEIQGNNKANTNFLKSDYT